MRKQALLILVLIFCLGLIANVTAVNGEGITNRRTEVTTLGAPLTSGYRLTSEVQISPSLSPEVDRYLPAIAYNSNTHEYLVAWHQVSTAFGKRQIFTRLIARDGTPLGYPHWIPYQWNDCFQPAVAYDATDDQYLVVWMYDVNGDGSRYEIWGQLLHANNEPVASAFLIFTWANRKFWTPRVAWNSQQNNFLVLWNAFDATTNLPTDISGVHVSSSGVPDVAAHNFTTTQSPYQANLAYNAITNQYLIVWRREYTITDWDIWGVLVNANGSLAGSEFAIDYDTMDTQSPVVATSGNHYWVAWQHWAGNTGWNVWDILGQVFKADGTALSGTFPIAATTFSVTTPAVVASQNGLEDFLTVYQQYTPTGIALRARRDRMVGDTLLTAQDQFDVAPDGFWNNTNPVVASAPDGYFIAYEGDSTSDPTVYQYIYGRAWLANAIYLPLLMK